jgi:hypothetical protein
MSIHNFVEVPDGEEPQNCSGTTDRFGKRHEIKRDGNE